ncbi:MAG: SGNH/GDSL hydrolase family protein [Solirubrobacterales bacterium]|nr:SGNH/GDSL hydrolase family protein [Solirubrobacterales bacterium]
MSFERYVALGDSTTEGLEDPYPDGSYRGWADRLARHLAAQNPDLTYANLAIRGRKLPQIRAEQLEPALALEPDLATILGGFNDIIRPSVDLAAIGADFDALVAGLRGAGATVLVMTYPDPTAVISLAAGRIRERVIAFNETIRGVATEHGAVLVDLDRQGVTNPLYWSADRLHANPLGHERMAAAAASALGVDPGEGWDEVLPMPAQASRPVRFARDAAWAGRHLTPWVVRRIRGRSSGDGRDPKRPDLGAL